MADFEVERSIVATADLDGSATVVRTWIITNDGRNEVDLTSSSLFVELTSGDIRVVSFTDEDGMVLPFFKEERDAGNGKTTVVCWFSANLPPEHRLTLHLTYRDPRFMRRLQALRGGIASEFLERAGVLAFHGATEHQRADYSYRLSVPDPRRRFLSLFANPFEGWEVDGGEDCIVRKANGRAEVSYDCVLAPGDRSRNLNIVSLRSGRALWAGLASGSFSIVAGALVSKLIG